MLLLTAVNVGAYSIVSSGDWIRTLDKEDFIGPSGFELIDSVESGPEQVTLTLSSSSSIPKKTKLTVNVAMSVPDCSGWSRDPTLYIRRTTGENMNGVADLKIKGGTKYSKIKENKHKLFKIQFKSERNPDWSITIPIQFKLEWKTSNLSPSRFNTTISYTLTVKERYQKVETENENRKDKP